MLITVRNKRNLRFKRTFRLKLNFYSKLKRIFLKKHKWQKFLKFYSIKVGNNSKQKYLVYDQTVIYTFKPSLLLAKSLKSVIFFKQQIKSFYGGILKRYIKIKVKFFIKNRNSLYRNFKNISVFFINMFAKRLDNFLHKTRFFLTLFNAKQAINHANIFVNNFIIKTNSFVLCNGDFICINSKVFPLIEKFITCYTIWPVIPKYCKVNYRTLEAFYIQNSNFSTNFSELSNWLNFQAIVKLYR